MCVDLYVCVRVLARALRGVVLLLTTLSTTFIQKGVLLYFFFFLALPDKIFGFRRRVERCRTHAFLFYRLKLLHSNISKKKKKKTHHHTRRKKKKKQSYKVE